MFHQKRETLESKTIDSLMGVVYFSNIIDINTGIFMEGINTGKIGNIDSENLRATLYNFVRLIQDIKVREEIWTNDLNNAFGKFLYKNFNYRNMDNSYTQYKGRIGETTFKDFDNLSILDNMEFENYMDNRFFNNSLQLELYENLYLVLRNIEKLLSE